MNLFFNLLLVFRLREVFLHVENSPSPSGSLHVRVQDWLLQNHNTAYCGNVQMKILESVNDFPERFINHPHLVENFDDEDLDAWELEVRRWARVLFLVIKEEHQLVPLVTVCLQLLPLCPQSFLL